MQPIRIKRISHVGVKPISHQLLYGCDGDNCAIKEMNSAKYTRYNVDRGHGFGHRHSLAQYRPNKWPHGFEGRSSDAILRGHGVSEYQIRNRDLGREYNRGHVEGNHVGQESYHIDGHSFSYGGRPLRSRLIENTHQSRHLQEL